MYHLRFKDSTSSLKEMKTDCGAASEAAHIHTSQSDSKLFEHTTNSSTTITDTSLPLQNHTSGEKDVCLRITTGLSRQDSGLPASLPTDVEDTADESQVHKITRRQCAVLRCSILYSGHILFIQHC